MLTWDAIECSSCFLLLAKSLLLFAPLVKVPEQVKAVVAGFVRATLQKSFYPHAYVYGYGCPPVFN